MKLHILNFRQQTLLLGLAVASAIQTIFAQTPIANLERHLLTWSNYDGIPKNGSAPVFKFDGKAYSQSQIDNFRVPEMRLNPHSILDVYIPNEAKVDDPAFIMPFGVWAIYDSWMRVDVNIIYHYKGHLIDRRVLIVHFRKPSDEPDGPEVSLDSKPYGVGNKAFDKLEQIEWKSPSFLDIRIIYDFPDYPNSPGFSLPDSFRHKLDQSDVKINGWSQEFTNQEIGVKR